MTIARYSIVLPALSKVALDRIDPLTFLTNSGGIGNAALRKMMPTLEATLSVDLPIKDLDEPVLRTGDVAVWPVASKAYVDGYAPADWGLAVICVSLPNVDGHMTTDHAMVIGYKFKIKKLAGGAKTGHKV